MKKVILIILLLVGFILAISEGETFLPNIIGILLSGFSANKLKVFEA